MVKFKVEDANFNKIYPVGSIYMSINETNPSELFGGEWEQIKDRFLLACGTKHPNGQMDGSEDAVVVKHNHTQNGHTHGTTTGRNFIAVGNGDNWQYTNKRAMNYGTGNYYYPYSTENNNGITEPQNTASTTATNKENGVDGTGKNMPPYLAVYCWVRIA